MRRIVFSLVPPSTATATAVLFLFNVIETKFLRASSTSESSHSLDPKPTLGLAFRSGSSLCLAHRSRRTYDWRMPICHRAFNERGESAKVADPAWRNKRARQWWRPKTRRSILISSRIWQSGQEAQRWKSAAATRLSCRTDSGCAVYRIGSQGISR